MQGLLNDWRRTNYAKDTTPEIAGEDVTIMGWVHEIRDFGGIMFVIIRDVTGRVQITAPSKKVEAEILEQLRELRKESVVAIKGIAQEAPKAPNGVEILPKEVKVLNLANQPLPMDPTEKVKAGIDTRLDSRFLDIRKDNVSAIFKIKGQINTKEPPRRKNNQIKRNYKQVREGHSEECRTRTGSRGKDKRTLAGEADNALWQKAYYEL